MARSARQNKILELISIYEIETQDDLVSRLRANNFDVTQATISRDIKELGLIKILSPETGKYKYAFTETAPSSNKYIYILKDTVISMKSVKNMIILKTIKGFASGICGIIDKFNIDDLLGATYGDDTVSLIFVDSASADYSLNKLESIINS